MAARSISIYGVYFDSKGRVLLIKDSTSLLWGFPGGKVEAGETHTDALRREFLEETGMKIRGSQTYITRQDDSAKQRYFYKVEVVQGQLNKRGNGTDVVRATYFDVSKLPLHNAAPGIESVINAASNPTLLIA